MDSITVGPFSFRWDGNGITVTSPGGQDHFDAVESMRLLAWLYDQRDNIMAARHNLPEWARPDQIAQPPYLLKPGSRVQIVEVEETPGTPLEYEMGKE
jgi:hypothetical protein